LHLRGDHSMETESEKYLTFFLDQNEYAIPVDYVREIIGMIDKTWVPRMPDYVIGLINLRGKVISLMDLRIRFQMTSKEYSPRTCIIVVEVIGEDGRKMMGLIVDSVSEVIQIEESEKEPSSNCGVGLEHDFIESVGNLKGKVILMLQMERVLNIEIMDFHEVEQKV